MLRFLILYADDIKKGIIPNIEKLHSIDNRCIEDGITKDRMSEFISFFPKVLDFSIVSRTDEWKIYEKFFQNFGIPFEEKYKQALDMSIKFNIREIKKYKLLGIMKCSAYARLAFSLLKKNNIRVLHVSTALLSDLEYAYTRENLKMKTVERIKAHREVAVFDEETRKYKVLTVCKCCSSHRSKSKMHYKLIFAKDEYGQDFELIFPLYKNQGRKIFFPTLTPEKFVITKNGVCRYPPNDFTTQQRNNYLMTGCLNNNICPPKYW